jgi:hypothetical protein
MCAAEGIHHLVADRLLCPEKAVQTHLFSNNLDVPLPASCRNKGTAYFRTRLARALIVVSCPNEKDSSPSTGQTAADAWPISVCVTGVDGRVIGAEKGAYPI